MKAWDRVKSWLGIPAKELPQSVELVEEGSELAELATKCNKLLHHVVQKQLLHREAGEALPAIYLRERDWPEEYALCKKHNVGSMNGTPIIWEPLEEEGD